MRSAFVVAAVAVTVGIVYATAEASSTGNQSTSTTMTAQHRRVVGLATDSHQQQQQHYRQHWTDGLDDVDLMLMSLGGNPIDPIADPSNAAAAAAADISSANDDDDDGADGDSLASIGNLTGDLAAGGNYTCASLEMSTVHRILMAFYAFVFVGGFVGNAMIIYAVLSCSGMQTVTNRYILNLAIADECFLIGMPFLIATMNVGDWVFGKWMCKAYLVSTSITQFTSSLLLLIMSADRYVAICCHISSPKYRTPNVSRALSALAWITSAALICPIIRYADVIDKGGERYTCTVVWPDGRAYYGLSFTLYTLVFGFIVPLGFILVFYGAVLLKLRRVSQQTLQQRSAKGSARHRKVTRLVLSVIAAYICCWTPYWIGQLALIFTPNRVCSSRLEMVAFLATGCLGYLNSAINPVLYAYLSETFRKSLINTVACLRWCGAVGDSVGGGVAGRGGGNGRGGGMGKGKGKGHGGGGGGGGGGRLTGGGGLTGGGRRNNAGSDATGLLADNNGPLQAKRGSCETSTGGFTDVRGGGGNGIGRRGSETQVSMVTTRGGFGGSSSSANVGGASGGYLCADAITTVTTASATTSTCNPSPPVQQRNGGGGGGGKAAANALATVVVVSTGDMMAVGVEVDNEMVPLSTAA